MVDPLIAVVVATVAGAVLNTIRGYLNTDEKYDIKKFFGALIVSGFAGLAIAQTIQTSGIDIIGCVLVGNTNKSLTAGLKKGVSKAKKSVQFID